MSEGAQINNAHWTWESYKQRMTTKEWREILLEERDHILYKGNLIPLVARSLGHGVVEVTKNLKGKNDD